MSDIFRRQTIDDYTVIEFITPSLMDPLVLESTAQALYKIVDEEDHRKIIMDFEKVQYLSSQAIGIVLTMNKKLGAPKNSKLILCGVGPRLMELLKITRLDRLLTVKPTPVAMRAGMRKIERFQVRGFSCCWATRSFRAGTGA